MSLQNYKDWNADQVRAEYRELKRKMFDLRLKLGIGQLSDYSSLKKTKRELAKLLTYARQKGFTKIR